MRRIYYACALRLATQPLFLHTLFLVGSVYILSRLIHVAAIVNNLRVVRVRDLDNYLFNTLMQAEFWTLLCTGLVLFAALSFPLRLSAPKTQNPQTV
jgi:uncharacterized membrane protein YecN with MAPEG domain